MLPLTSPSPPHLDARTHKHFKMLEVEVEDHTDGCKECRVCRVCRVHFSGPLGISENSGITRLSKMPLQPIAADILQILAAELTAHEQRVEKKVKAGGGGLLCMHTYVDTHIHNTQY